MVYSKCNKKSLKGFNLSSDFCFEKIIFAPKRRMIQRRIKVEREIAVLRLWQSSRCNRWWFVVGDNSGDRKTWTSSEWDLVGRVNRMEDGLSERKRGIKGMFCLEGPGELECSLLTWERVGRGDGFHREWFGEAEARVLF